MKKKIGLSFIVIIVFIQFFRIDQLNPETVIENDFISITKPDGKIKELLNSSCYNCHSNKTTYPWYANIAPISWWVKHHVNEAKEHLNFSEWAAYSEKEKKHKLHECYEEVEEGEMPLKTYTWMHGEANMTAVEREYLEDWFKSFGEFHDTDGD